MYLFSTARNKVSLGHFPSCQTQLCQNHITLTQHTNPELYRRHIKARSQIKTPLSLSLSLSLSLFISLSLSLSRSFVQLLLTVSYWAQPPGVDLCCVVVTLLVVMMADIGVFREKSGRNVFIFLIINDVDDLRVFRDQMTFQSSSVHRMGWTADR